jgi:hypothetical protein
MKKDIVIASFLLWVIFGCTKVTPTRTSDHPEIVITNVENNNYEYIEKTESILDNLSEIISMGIEFNNYEFIENMEFFVDNRFFKAEDIPKNIFEEIVFREYLYTVTAEFEKKYVILADIETHVISIENEKWLFEEGIFVQSYIVHRITTLTKEQYSLESTVFGEINPLFYWGWQRCVNEFDLIDYQIVNVDFSVIYSTGGIQWGDGRYNRSFIVGKKSGDITYKIYDFGFM